MAFEIKECPRCKELRDSQEREERHLNDMLPVWAGWIESGRPIEDTNRQLMVLDIRAAATRLGELERELADVEDLCRHRFGLKRDAEDRANRAEAGLVEVRAEVERLVDRYRDIAAGAPVDSDLAEAAANVADDFAVVLGSLDNEEPAK